jgi:glutamyl-tRNA synthetase
MSIRTRFAPSPTGYLHIGGARTALFNWLYARHHGGAFLLRIEDTDRERSTPEATEAIFESLTWLQLDWDEDPVFQSTRAPRHVDVVNQLLESGLAYRCYASPEELAEMREKARAEKRPVRYDGRWRGRDPGDAPAGVAPAIRLKAPQDGETVVEDQVQGRVTVPNEQLDDMVLLRADGTPTYMLAVVVDDHDMAVTNVIRGQDHLTNTFRQWQIYAALGWEPPRFAHVPLIHGADGAKLSKRHAALGAETYRELGFLPEAMNNYLLRLGWGHGDDEIISREDAIRWFDLDGVGQAPARFDMVKLSSLNAHYLRTADEERLVSLVLDRLSAKLGDNLDTSAHSRLKKGMPGLKTRAKTVEELAQNAVFYAKSGPVVIEEAAQNLLTDAMKCHVRDIKKRLASVSDWTAALLEAEVRAYVDGIAAMKLGTVAQGLRAALTGMKASPPIFEVMEVLGPTETLSRLASVVDGESEPASAG